MATKTKHKKRVQSNGQGQQTLPPYAEEKLHRILGQVVSPWDEDAGIEVPRSYAFGDFLSVYGEGKLGNVWIFRAVRAISEAESQLPLNLQRINGKGQWETVTSGPLPKLFRDINPIMTYYDFSEAVSVYLELTGNSFLALENRSPRTGYPREIWPIRPDLVRIHPDEETGEVLGYSVHLGKGAKPIIYGRDEMIHFKYFNPTNYYWGLSPLSAHRMGILFEYYTKQWESNFFRHGVRETGILTTGGKLDDKQYGRLLKQAEARWGGYEKAHRPMLLEGGLDWKRISVPPKDMEYKALKEWNKDEVQATYNIPPLKLMDLKEASVLANAEVQERIFWGDTIIPRLKKKEGYYTEFLLPFFFKKSELSQYRFRFNMSEIRSLQMNEKDKAEISRQLTSGPNPIFSVDEVRERFYNLPPAPWGGREPFIPGNLVPAGFLTGEGQKAFENKIASSVSDMLIKRLNGNTKYLIQEGKEHKDGDIVNGEILAEDENHDYCDGKDSPKATYTQAYIHELIPEFDVSEDHIAYWKAWALKRLEDEERFVLALNEEFRRQMNETLKNIDGMVESGQTIPVKSLLFDEKKAITGMKRDWHAQFGFIFPEVTAEEMESWGLVNVEAIDSATVIEYGNNQASWFAGTGRETLLPGQYPGITGTQLNNLEKALNEGYRLGEGIPELTKRVEAVFAGTIREEGYAARRIARTETTRIANWTRDIQYRRNSHIVKGKQWLAQLDARVDEICAELHGETAKLGDLFLGMYNLPPDPHPSCRCVSLPILTES